MAQMKEQLNDIQLHTHTQRWICGYLNIYKFEMCGEHILMLEYLNPQSKIISVKNLNGQ